MKKTTKARTIYAPDLLDMQVVRSYMTKVVAGELEEAMLRRFHKKLKTMCSQLAKHLIDKYEITLMNMPDIKSDREILAIKLDDKNLYKLKSK